MAGNLKLGADGDIIIGRGATRVGGVEYVAQLVKNRLLTLLGEWQNDTGLGLPWYTQMLSKNAKVSDIQVAIANIIRTTNHVRLLLDLQVDANYSERTLKINFNALSDFGDVADIISWKL